MSKYKIEFSNNRKQEYSGFFYSIDFKSKYHVGVLAGIFKRQYWYIGNGNINLGHLFINLSGIINLLKGKN